MKKRTNNGASGVPERYSHQGLISSTHVFGIRSSAILWRVHLQHPKPSTEIILYMVSATL